MSLRKKIFGELNQSERLQDSVSFLKQYDNSFHEHDYGSKNKNQKVLHNVEGKTILDSYTEEEYNSIEKTVKDALEQSNYFGKYVLKIEDFDETGLRKVRIVKENGINVIMKLRMPESMIPENVRSKPVSPSNGAMDLILKKCDEIVTSQEKMSRSIFRTEKTVVHISSLVQNYKIIDQTIDLCDGNGGEKDKNAPFELPINQLNELWRLNSRIIEPDLREAMNDELGKLQPQPGMKIIGRVLRSVIAKDLLGQLCWSGRIKVEHKYMKSDDRIMLSKMKNLVDYLFELCKAKEDDTTMHVFLQTIMNIIRKERFRVRE